MHCSQKSRRVGACRRSFLIGPYSIISNSQNTLRLLEMSFKGNEIIWQQPIQIAPLFDLQVQSRGNIKHALGPTVNIHCVIGF